MTSCISCGREVVQDYTLDEIFNCNNCLENSTPPTIPDYAINNNDSNSNTSQENICMNLLISQIDFLKNQIVEKDHFIRQILSILKEKTECNNFSTFPKVSTSSPIIQSLLTPSQVSPGNFSDTGKESNSDESKTHLLTTDEEVNYSSNEENNTYVIKDEYCSPYANEDDINQQLKNVRLQYHNNYMNNKSIYSTITDASLTTQESTIENETETKRSENFIKKATIEQRRKVKIALEKLNVKGQVNNHATYTPRYRIDNKTKPWPNKTILIAGDSTIQGLEERRLRKFNVKIRSFPGARIDDFYDYLKPLIKKEPSIIILHIGTNDSTNKTSGQIINEINNLMNHIQEMHPKGKIYLSSPILRFDNPNANHTLEEVRTYFKSLPNSILNCNIDKGCLGGKGLHLNPRGSGRLAINFISLMKRL